MSIIVQPELWYGAPYVGGVGQQSPMWFNAIGEDNRWYFSSVDVTNVDYIGGNLRVPRTLYGETNLQGALSGAFPANVVPGSVHLRAGSQTITDDDGSLVGDINAQGMIDYASGTWSFTAASSFVFTEGSCLVAGDPSAPPLPNSLSFDWEIVEPTGDPPADFFFYYTLDHGAPVITNLGSSLASGTIVVTIPQETESLSWGVYSAGWDIRGEPAIYSGVVAVGETVAPADPPQYGTVINIVEKDVLDSFSARWTRPTSRTPGQDLDYYKSYAMDPNDPLAFWLHPRGYDGADVIVTFAGIPEAVEATTDTLTLSDMYVPDLVDYLAYRSLSKDARAGAKDLAERFRNSFLMRLGAGRQIVKQIAQAAMRPPDAEA